MVIYNQENYIYYACIIKAIKLDDDWQILLLQPYYWKIDECVVIDLMNEFVTWKFSCNIHFTDHWFYLSCPGIQEDKSFEKKKKENRNVWGILCTVLTFTLKFEK